MTCIILGEQCIIELVSCDLFDLWYLLHNPTLFWSVGSRKSDDPVFDMILILGSELQSVGAFFFLFFKWLDYLVFMLWDFLNQSAYIIYRAGRQLEDVAFDSFDVLHFQPFWFFFVLTAAPPICVYQLQKEVKYFPLFQFSFL